ncbi:hypothetical protein W02_42330 [Nitrospira sp. KM1]|uniref:hypothetical protein n=1 Tax=Nitrospira sp. KM1 TaxID=1936990 RepID=UPI0013A791EC|nr:hypothetical protein [Nitrospira sp. KM1]BCA57093.1 hypothetical protein W02_42330 [Nitrospira sp. KM1]
MTRITRTLTAFVYTLSVSSLAHAGYLTDVGYDALLAEFGTSTPTGAGVPVTQVEAPNNDVSGGAPPVFMPDPSNSDFAGKVITSPNGNLSGAYSSHATSVGQIFYGNTGSMASGISQITSYEAQAWINTLAASGGAATTASSRIANHSRVGGGGDAQTDGSILRFVDRQVALKQYVQVVASTSSTTASPLLSDSYNSIVVGRTDGVNHIGTDAVDSVYVAGRTAPSIVAPFETPSAATPVVASAAALLIQTGHNAGSALSDGSTTISGVGTVYDAERAATVKAVLMAGADRQTANTSTAANITDYRSAGHQTTNGLDDRYGAGQVNIYNSYRILTGGEQKSFQHGGHDITTAGFDYASLGGLSGTPWTASYFFNGTPGTSLYASLVWNLTVSDNSLLATHLYNLDLSLFDATTNSLLASSSSLLDNTENIYFKLLLGTRYELRVTTSEAVNFLSDYALAWRIDSDLAAVPIPPSAWLFVSALMCLFVHRAVTSSCRRYVP